MFENLSAYDLIWLCIGFAGQVLFTGRFFVQWISSEKQRKSVIPISFWYYSIFGSLILCVYAIHKQDPVFILGQSTGIFIYVRNLYFIYRERQFAI